MTIFRAKLLGILAVYVFVSVSASTLSTVTVIPSNTTVRISTSYSINILTITAIPSGGYISIQFPSIFSLSDSAVSCSSASTSLSCACLTSSSNTLQISSCFPQSSSLILLTIPSLANPLYGGTGQFQVYTYGATGSVLDSKTSGLSVTYLPATMASASITPLTSVASALSTWSIAFYLSYEISSAGFINITMPSGYCSGTIACQGVNLSIASCYCYSGVSIVLATSAQGECTVLVSDITNPGSTAAASGFSVSSAGALGSVETISGLSVQVAQGASLSLSASPTNAQVFVTTDYYLQMQCAGDVPSGSDLEIVFPSECGVTAGTSVAGVFGTANSLVYSITANAISVTAATVQEISAGSVIGVTVCGVQNPASTRVSSEGSVNINYNSGNVCTGTFTVQASVGALEFSVTPRNLMVNQVTTYDITISTLHVFDNTALEVVFPSDIGTGNAECSVCEAGSAFVVVAASGSSLGLSISNVKNAGVARSTGGFTATSYTDTSLVYAIETNSSASVLFTPGNMQVLVTPQSLITGDYTDYVFALTITDAIPAGGALGVVFPTDIIITDVTASIFNTVNLASGFLASLTAGSVIITNAFASNFAGNIQFTVPYIQNPTSTKPTTIECYSTSGGYYIDSTSVTLAMTLTHSPKSLQISLSNPKVGAISSYFFAILPFNPQISSIEVWFSYSIPSPICNYTCTGGAGVNLTISASSSQSVLYFSIDSVINPLSTGGGQLNVSTFYQGYISDSAIGSIIITEPGALTATFSRNNENVGEECSASISITTVNAVPTGGYLSIQIPGGTTAQCVYIQTVSCNYVNDAFNLYIFQSDFSGTLGISLTNLLNTANTQPISIEICTKSSSYLIDCLSLQISNTCTSPCSNCEITATNCTACEAPLFLYNNSCSASCPSGYYNSGSECVACNSLCPTCESSTNCTSCVISHPFNNNGVCLEVCPPSYYPDTTFSCQVCSGGCIKCTSSTQCTECSTGNLYSGQCQAECPTGWYPSSSICQQCPAPCLSCQGKSSCLSCTPGLLLYNGLCLDTCPEGTSIQFEATCTACTFPCTTCSLNTTNCTSCSSGLLYNYTCLASCPSGYYSSSNSCEKCSKSCGACINTSTTCTECTIGEFLYGEQCVDACPAGSVLIDGECKCPEHCASCNASACTSCYGGYVLYDGVCAAECAERFFNSSGVCVSCQNGCEQCRDTSSCSSCSEQYYLYGGGCYGECPNTTYAEGGVCVQCTDPCLYCLGNGTNNCTLCNSPLVLFESECVSSCPENYTVYFQKCLANSLFCAPNCTEELLSNTICDIACNVKACNFDNGFCSSLNYSDSLDLKSLPLPLSMAGGLSVAASGASSLLFGGSVLAAGTSITSLVEGCAVAALIGTVGTADGVHGRIVLDIDNTYVKTVFTLLFIVTFIHICTNIAFAVVFVKWIIPRDNGLRMWHKQHPCAFRTFIMLSVGFSYKFCRLCTSGLFGLDCCKASMSSPRIFLKPLIYTHYFSLGFVSLPMLGILAYIFTVFSHGSYTYLVGIDTAVVVILSVLLTIIDTVFIHLQGLRESTGKARVTTPTDTAENEHKTYIEGLKNKYKMNEDQFNESIILNLEDREPQLLQKLGRSDLVVSTAVAVGEYIMVKHRESGMTVIIKSSQWKVEDTGEIICEGYEILNIQGVKRALVEVNGAQVIAKRKIEGIVYGVMKDWDWKFDEGLQNLSDIKSVILSHSVS